MRKSFSKIIISILAISVIFGAIDASSQNIWVNRTQGMRQIDVKDIFVAGSGFYLASDSSVYKGKDLVKYWEHLFSVPQGGNNGINCLSGYAGGMLLGTKRGLLLSEDGGMQWKNIFRTLLPDKNDILCIEVSRSDPKEVWIGTQKGVFTKTDSSDKWTDLSANLKNKPVRCLALNSGRIYAYSDGGFYFRKDDISGWERLIISSVPEDGTEAGEVQPSEDGGEENYTSSGCIAVKDKYIYVGVNKKISCFDEGSNTWRALPANGLKGVVTYILPSHKSDAIYCATSKGVFKFKDKWTELYVGKDGDRRVNKILFYDESEKYILAATSKGLYTVQDNEYIDSQRVDVEKNLKSFTVHFENEPSFSKLQAAAIKFAEVSPEKISRWRTEARLKALMPKVSIGIDNNRATNSEIYTSATKDYVVTGPDDISGGIDVSVSWDLAELIWSDDQTSIDVRSRLMVQLRNDILDDLRRVYYERRRIQFELMTDPPQNMKTRFEKEMRLQELTQAIDDLTGNYLSENMAG